MTNVEFVNKLKLAESLKTLYVYGGFGAVAGYGDNRSRYIESYEYNKRLDRSLMILLASKDTFFFDCICLGKGILWGWYGDQAEEYGGAKYGKDYVPDFTIDKIPDYCQGTYIKEKPKAENLTIGEWLVMPGHVGYYIGNGEVIECSPSGSNGVQRIKLKDRDWKAHGKLKDFIEYIENKVEYMIYLPMHYTDYGEAKKALEKSGLSGIIYEKKKEG